MTSDIWKDRAKAVDDIITHLEKYCQKIAQDQGIQNDNARIGTIWALLQLLRSFGYRQFEFFYNEFQKEPRRLQYTDTLESDSGFEHYRAPYDIDDLILASIVTRVSTDVAMLRAAIDHRVTSQLFSGENSFDRLQIADWLALAALKRRSISDPLSDKGTVLTYYRNAVSVRIIPYAPVPLIGVPVTILQTNQDYLAIPHEVAHHFYWHGWEGDGPSLASDLRANLQINPQFLSKIDSWLEEIFADVVGCMIGGTAIARSFHEIMRQAIGNEFISGDGKHPSPWLRPYIYTEILKEMAIPSESLEQAWDSLVKARCPQGIADTKLLDAVKSVAKQIYEIADKAGVQPWKPTAESDEEFEHLFFDGSVEDLQNHFPPGPPVDLEPIKAELLSISAIGTSPNPAINTWFTVWQELIEKKLPNINWQPDADSIPAKSWLALFEFGGWSTEGPGPGQVGG